MHQHAFLCNVNTINEGKLLVVLRFHETRKSNGSKTKAFVAVTDISMFVVTQLNYVVVHDRK